MVCDKYLPTALIGADYINLTFEGFTTYSVSVALRKAVHFLLYLWYDHLTIGEANPLKIESMFFQLGTSDSVTPTTTENGRHYCHPEVLRTKREPATVKELSPRLFDDPSSEPIPSSPNLQLAVFLKNYYLKFSPSVFAHNFSFTTLIRCGYVWGGYVDPGVPSSFTTPYYGVMST